MRIGIFGGSFDPIHIGHMIIAENALTQLKLDKVIFIPAHINPLKKNNHADDKDRLAMVKLAIKNNPRFKASDIEIKRKGVSYTIDTLRKFKRAQLFLILGSDSLALLPKWKDLKEIRKLAKIAVAPRILEKKVSVPFLKIESPIVNVSSTAIRERAKKGKPIKYFVPESVRKYIERKGLYR